MAESVFTCEEVLALDCIVCSASFSFPKPVKGRYPRFCSTECKAERVKGQMRSYREPAAHKRACEVCEKTFTARKPSAKYCSDGCRNRRPRENRGRRASGKHKIEQRACKACSIAYHARRDNSRVFCSDPCKEDWRRVIQSVSHTVYRRLRVEPVARRCPDCGGELAPQQHRCPPCREAAHAKATVRAKQNEKKSGAKAARRRARKLKLRGVRVEAVNLLEVLERDKWTCQLCGIKAPKKLRGTYDDRAPEVDHIIPIAQGGEHSYRNTQCACRKCNIAKSANPMGQLRLF